MTTEPTTPTPIECARAIEGFFTCTVEASVTAVQHLGHNVWTADAEIFYDEPTEHHKEGDVEQRQFLIASVDGRLLVNP